MNKTKHMANKKGYGHLWRPIQAFFRARGVSVVLEPHGTRGADIENLKKSKKDAVTLVGEIKHDKELRDAMESRYWVDWQSDRPFGGKRSDERLLEVERIPETVEDLSAEARGFVATIQGQLKRSYVRRAGLNEGWLVLENMRRWGPGVKSALEFLGNNHLIADYEAWRDKHDIGFIKIQFTEVESDMQLMRRAKTLWRMAGSHDAVVQLEKRVGELTQRTETMAGLLADLVKTQAELKHLSKTTRREAQAAVQMVKDGSAELDNARKTAEVAAEAQMAKTQAEFKRLAETTRREAQAAVQMVKNESVELGNAWKTAEVAAEAKARELEKQAAALVAEVRRQVEECRQEADKIAPEIQRLADEVWKKNN